MSVENGVEQIAHRNTYTNKTALWVRSPENWLCVDLWSQILLGSYFAEFGHWSFVHHGSWGHRNESPRGCRVSRPKLTSRTEDTGGLRV